MTRLAPLYARLDALAPALLPSLARLVFAGVLARYFLGSALTKFDGLSIDANAYVQILPKAMAAVGYDPSQLGLLSHAIVWGGSVAEIILPLLILLGLLARPAALAMIGFVVVQSLTDLWGHGMDVTTFGRWFDAASGSLVADQRALWILLLSVIVMLGAGPVALDRLIYKNRA